MKNIKGGFDDEALHISFESDIRTTIYDILINEFACYFEITNCDLKHGGVNDKADSCRGD